MYIAHICTYTCDLEQPLNMYRYGQAKNVQISKENVGKEKGK